MIIRQAEVTEQDLGGGIRLREVGAGVYLSARHWRLADGAVVVRHQHPEEQFGTVIAGGFRVTIGDETVVIGPGDAYFIPPGVPHEFVATGETEAIDVFSPPRTALPGGAPR